MRRILSAAILLLALAASPVAHAVQPDEIMADPAKEARARNLSRELRCMVCQNQSIDDSEAPLARDLRLLVRERIAAGDSDHQVIDFLVARYGQFVLLKPRFERETLLLWLQARRRGQRAVDATPRLSAEEEARLAALMSAEGKPPLS